MPGLDDRVAVVTGASGGLGRVFEDDEDAGSIVNIPAEENRALREAIAAAPDRYLEVPGVDHGGRHDILRAFPRSSWTDDDDAAWQRACDAYRGSIGRWKDAVDDRDVIHAYHRFQERESAGNRRTVPARQRHRARVEVTSAPWAQFSGR